ncbi:helix-turn-helix domain-containing protein [Xanthobacteraceae bacterium Astr-EGSB]|uniref:helix-turn-helix domain-containing protein n=1 Tax=Astrobacterium formosum TaxID=3069710 RepID=UPI0027B2F97B|nr:helix-turn-helix domain-containing protein [Xanthobacteraceae bacterium Astr-EGSB]
MLTLLDSRRNLFVASDEEAMVARAAAARLESIGTADGCIPNGGVYVRGGDGEIALDARAVGLIDGVLAAVGAGRALAIVPESDEFTVEQAAAFLGIGRDEFAALLAQDAIPHYLVGTRCRVLKSDLVAWQRQDSVRDAVLADAREVLFPEPRRFGAA